MSAGAHWAPTAGGNQKARQPFLSWALTPSTAALRARVIEQDCRHQAPYTPLGDVLPWLLKALIATEGERFSQHHDIDTLGLLRAAWEEAHASRKEEASSPLSVLLAKNAYLGGDEHTVPRKLANLLLALKVEQRIAAPRTISSYNAHIAG